MKRSAINAAYREALAAFERAGWAIPPHPRWDVTDFGCGNFDHCGIVLINLAEEPEYCEKLIYMRAGQALPAHTHRKKKEDIICRRGELTMELWAGPPASDRLGAPLRVKRSGEWAVVASGHPFTLGAGERVTLVPGIYHRFWPARADTVISEVSTANDDANDNIFADRAVARFPGVVEDEPAAVRLVSDR